MQADFSQETNVSKLNKLLSQNGGFITRTQVDKNNISSWFLTDFVRKNNLEKLAPGFYAKTDWIPDDFFIFQYQYPKFIFSYESALYLLNLTDTLPQSFEVTGPKNYRPFNTKNSAVIVHTDYKKETYELGITQIKTNLGNNVQVYNAEKTICDLIRHSQKIDSENYTKSLHNYAKLKDKNISRLIEYSKIMGIEKKVSEIMMVVLNES